MSSIVVENASDAPIYAFVSTFEGSSGDASWFKLDIGKADTWSRTGWQVVGFKNVDDSQRAAVYVKPDAIVKFFSMTNIQVE